jgi:hypothetical protein
MPTAIASNGRIVGTSPLITISAEEMSLTNVHNITKVKIDGVKPPEVAQGSAFSHAMNLWIQLWPHWNYNKITEPKYDGIGDDIGQISNRPDFIKDYHAIGIMRNVDAYLRPSFFSHIYAQANMPTPTPPPTPADDETPV